MPRTLALWMTLAALPLAAAPARADIIYSVTDLGTLGGSFSDGIAVNSGGAGTGQSRTPNDAARHAFLSGFNGGQPLKDLGTLGGLNSIGWAVNASGQVAGNSDLAPIAPGNVPSHAFLTDANGGSMHDLGTFGGRNSSASGVNASGQVTGYANLPNNAVGHAFLSGSNGGALKDLGTLGGTTSFGFAVNDAGQVAGGSDTLNDATRHAFLSSPNGGALKDLGTLGGSFGVATGVNALGQVIGEADLPGSLVSHAFLTDPNGGTMHDLGSFGGDSQAIGINASGQVIGFSYFADPNLGGAIFLYSGGTTYDLSTLLEPGTMFTLRSVSGINDAGQIIGSGIGPDGQDHAILLTPVPVPVPEPSTLVLFGSGALGLLGCWYRRIRAGRPTRDYGLGSVMA